MNTNFTTVTAGPITFVSEAQVGQRVAQVTHSGGRWSWAVLSGGYYVAEGRATSEAEAQAAATHRATHLM